MQRIIVFILAFLISLPVFAQRNLGSIGANNNLPSMLKNISPAVVNIATMGEISMMIDPKSIKNADPESMDIDPNTMLDQSSGLLPVKKKFNSVGSGVIVDAAHGYVITNAHVIKDAKTTTVTLTDQRRFIAKVIGTDAESDIAVLQIKPERLSAIRFGDSDRLKVGESVYAIGNPFGIGQTVTSGIISGLGRSDLHIENFEDFIQTDASINPGNSGGPLIDTSGAMIGVNTAIVAPAGGNVGIGFAIPANMAHSVMMQLIKYGTIHRGFIGIIVNDLTSDIATSLHVTQEEGALVALVIPNSPAAKAGLKVGDIIVRINGVTIKNAASVRNYVGLQQVGATLMIEYLRGGKTITTHIVTADPDVYQHQIEISNPFLYGLDLQAIDVQTSVAGAVKGIQVLRVATDSLAWRSGVREGDIILSANLKPVSSISDLNSIAKTNTNQLLLNVFRPAQNASSFVVLKF